MVWVFYHIAVTKTYLAREKVVQYCPNRDVFNNFPAVSKSNLN